MRFVAAVPMLAAGARASKGARALRAPRARTAPRAAPRAALQPRQILGLAALASAAPLAALASAAPLAALGPAGPLAALASAAPLAALATAAHFEAPPRAPARAPPRAPARAPPRAARPAARPFAAAAGCALHGLPCCPGCDPRAYTIGRVTRAVEFGLKRLKIRKPGSVLRCLGARSWDEVHAHFERKRAHWNRLHPETPMTLTNSAIDHIRPVDAFQGGCPIEKATLCNHLSNLQPLLVQDNLWKGRTWDAADEAFWRSSIVMRAYPGIYYPRARVPLSEIERARG